jgi:RNA polymerase sigma factor (TIGR02999 family)
MPPSHEVTQLLLNWSRGDPESLERLIPLVYEELHRLAHSCLRRERPGHTLQATALVHEAYLRLVDQSQVQWQNRAHFLAIAANLMRKILINYARDRKRYKRGGGGQKLSLEDVHAVSKEPGVDLVALDEALERLAAIDPQQGRIVELRYFGGLTIEETAEALGTSPATVKREWSLARAWLDCELRKGGLG